MPLGAARITLLAKTQVTAVAEVIRQKKGVTAVGNAQVDTAQSKFGGSSALLDGTGDYLSINPANDFAFEGDFTVEFWTRPTNTTGVKIIYDARSFGGYSENTPVIYQDGSTFKFYFTADRATSGTISANTWYHLALTKSGNDYKFYVNGNQVGSTYTNSATVVASTSLWLGAHRANGAGTGFDYNGHIDELRISNTARYTGNFTAPTAPFVNDENTLLLLHCDGTDASTYFEDDNGVRAPIDFRASGNARVSTTRSKFSGTSLYFDGSGDYATGTGSISFPDNQDFTWEFWYNEDVSQNMKFIGGGTNQDIFIGRAPGIVFDGNIGIGIVGVGWGINFGTAGALDTWHHVCVQRSGDTVYCYLNGTQVVSTTTYNNRNWTWTNPVLGAETTGVTPYNGYLDEIRWSNVVRYNTAGFTPPTAPFVNDANTVCLIHGDGSANSTVINDDTGVSPARIPKHISYYGNAQIDTAQTKFGGASALFDGSNDYLDVGSSTDFVFLTNDITVEFWTRINAMPSSSQRHGLITKRRDASAQTGTWGFSINGTTQKISWGIPASGFGDDLITTTSTVSTGVWYHVAWCKTNGVSTLYLNGVSQGTYNDSVSYNYAAQTVKIGNWSILANFYFNGWIDEVRFSDIARYTGNFTPATEPFQNDDNTLLLLHMDGTDASTVFTDDVGARSKKGVTAVGNAQVDTAQSKFGGSSALFDGTSDALSIQPNTDFILGTNDWTVEMWIRPTANTATVLFDTRPFTSSNGLCIYYTGSALTYFTGNGIRITGSSWTLNTWQHIALVRSGNDHKLYINGTQTGSTYTATNSITSVQNFVTVGANTDTPYGACLNGHIDEVRVSNIARYTGNFTAPTEPFQNDDNTLLLLHIDGTDGSTVFTDDNGVTPNWSY